MERGDGAFGFGEIAGADEGVIGARGEEEGFDDFVADAAVGAGDEDDEGGCGAHFMGGAKVEIGGWFVRADEAGNGSERIDCRVTGNYLGQPTWKHGQLQRFIRFLRAGDKVDLSSTRVLEERPKAGVFAEVESNCFRA